MNHPALPAVDLTTLWNRSPEWRQALDKFCLKRMNAVGLKLPRLSDKIDDSPLCVIAAEFIDMLWSCDWCFHDIEATYMPVINSKFGNAGVRVNIDPPGSTMWLYHNEYRDLSAWTVVVEDKLNWDFPESTMGKGEWHEPTATDKILVCMLKGLHEMATYLLPFKELEGNYTIPGWCIETVPKIWLDDSNKRHSRRQFTFRGDQEFNAPVRAPAWTLASEPQRPISEAQPPSVQHCGDTCIISDEG